MNLEYPLKNEQIKFKSILVYKCKEREKYILIGSHPLVQQCSVIYLYIQKYNEKYTAPFSQVVVEENREFTSVDDAKKYLSKNYGMVFLYEAKGIIGFIKFLQGYYVILIKERLPTAKLGKHKIFSIDQRVMIELFEPRADQSSANESNYKKLFNEYDLEIGFYGSYTYDLTSTLAKNILRPEKQSRNKEMYQIGQFNNTFLWNHYVLTEFDMLIKNKRWLLPIIHGYSEQTTIKTFGNFFSITIIARRSIQHAGARYLTRGINERGFVANFVETEQIVIELDKSTPQRPACSSFVQIRGSAPVYWYQEPNLLIPKPPIKMNMSDPYLLATKKHFSDLFRNYGKQIFMVNLVKSNERTAREQLLAEEYQNAINFLKEELQFQHDIDIGYLHFDMKAQLKQDKEEFVSKCYQLAYYCLMKTGVFLLVSDPRQEDNVIIEMQNGIVRSNCIDCLDRTNTFQQLIGEMALGIQLAKINNTSLKFNMLEVNEKVYKEFREMYEQLGDFISLQYGSSLAHRQNIGHSAKRFEIITSLKRHLKNNMSDQNKQHQIDLFLGHYIPQVDLPCIWDTETHVTLYPDIKHLKLFVGTAHWWHGPYNKFLKDTHISDLQKQSIENDSRPLHTKKGLQTQKPFNWNIILRMTQKSSNKKTLHKFRYVIFAPKVPIREKFTTNSNSNFEESLKKPYYDVVFLDRDEVIKSTEDLSSPSSERSRVEVSPAKVQIDIDPMELDLYREYCRVKSLEELNAQADQIRNYIFKEIEDEDERVLSKDIKDYIDGKSQYISRECKADTVFIEDFHPNNVNHHADVKSSVAPSDTNHLHSNSMISVHQPKKITVEQKTMKFLESLLKKNQSQTQRLKINKI